MKLSICMMVKNEEKNLERCLISLQPLMKSVESDLIIVDTGSDDGTVEIAKKYTDKVYFHPWNNDFSAMRNITIGYAKGEWILIIDADEEIENAETIIQFLNSINCNDFVAGNVTIKNLLFDGLDKSIDVTNATRLLKNGKTLTFTGAVHESAYRTYKGGNVAVLKTIFRHYGYINIDSNKELSEKKYQRNLPLLLSELEKDPDNIYYRNYACAQYFVHKEYEKALEQALKAYDTIIRKKLNPKDYMFIYSKLAFCYIKINKYKEAEKICIEGLRHSDEQLDLHFVLALIEMKNQSYDSSIEHYKRYLYLMDNFNNLSISSETTANMASFNRYNEAYINLANIYIEQAKYDLALKYIQMADDEDFIKNIYGTYTKLFIKSKQFDKLMKYYENTILPKTEQIIDEFLLGIESYREKLNDNEWINLINEFSVGESPYSKYCEIRIAYFKKKQDVNGLINNFISSFNINKILYAEILFFLISLQEDVKEYANKTANEIIKVCIPILSQRFNNFPRTVAEYLEINNENDSFEISKIKRYLYFYLLDLDTLSDGEFHSALLGYINNSLIYMKKVYNNAVFENAMVYDVRDEYEAFLIIIQTAFNAEKTNESEYIKYMRKALNICPAMNKGIKLLLSEHEASVKKQAQALDQFEVYKGQVKRTIRDLISAGQIAQAKVIINEYKKIVNIDSEMDEIETEITLK